MEKLLSKFEKYILFTIVFLFPIFVLAISPNPYVVPKLALLTFGISLALLVLCLKIIYSGKLDFSVGNFDFPVLLIGLAYLASAILRTPNKMEALLLPGTATALVCGALLYFLINQLRNDDKIALSHVLLGSGAIFSLLTLFAITGVFAKIPQLPPFVKSTGFTPEGGYLPSVMFLGVLLPLGIGLFISEKNTVRKILAGVFGLIIILGISASLYSLLPGKTNAVRFPSFGVSWSIAIDSLKESPVLGIGPGNYLAAFNRYRPISYNSTDLWAVKFATARNFYFTALTEAGMLGAAGFLLLIWSVYKTTKKDLREQSLVKWGSIPLTRLISLGLLLIILAFFPATGLITVLVFILLSLAATSHKTSLNLITQGTPDTEISKGQQVASRFPAILLTVPVIISVLFISVRASQILAAEYTFQKSLVALSQNDASKTYDTMRKAIGQNPRVDRYHATFARVSLALANSIAQQATAGAKQDQPVQISDEDRKNISALVQQAIAEGKAAVVLNPTRSGNWELLAQVYRSIMPLAKGADTFAIQTYRQAASLDPINPNLRIGLGGIYFAQGDFENAVRTFELAAAAKPDYTNAHFNLAFALRQKGDLDRAIQEMTLVLSLIKRDTNPKDYDIAKKALEDMQAKKASEAPQGTELTPPQKTESQIKPPIDLPTDSQPPEAPISPTPSPTPTAQETVSPTLTPKP